jgi:hypothetical protein
MARSAQQVLDVREGPEEAYRRVANVLVELFGGPVESVSESELSVPTVVNLRSYGEVVRCTVEPAGGGSRIVVQSRSQVWTTLIDWGKNRDNVDATVAALSDVLSVRT